MSYDQSRHLTNHLRAQSTVDWQEYRRATTGRELRYLLTLHLLAAGPLTVAELVQRIEADGLELFGRPGNVVSDALRWEIGRRGVVRLGRGRYGPGVVPRQTLSRMRTAVAAERARVAALQQAS